MILKIAIWLYSRPQQECAFSGTHFSRIKDFRENYFLSGAREQPIFARSFWKASFFVKCVCVVSFERSHYLTERECSSFVVYCKQNRKRARFLYFRERKKAPTTPDGEKLIIVLDKHNWAFEKRNRENKLLDKITTLCESRAFFDGRKVHEISCNGKYKI